MDQSRRRQEAAGVVGDVLGDVLGKGAFRDGLDEETAVDIVWVLNDAGPVTNSSTGGDGRPNASSLRSTTTWPRILWGAYFTSRGLHLPRVPVRQASQTARLKNGAAMDRWLCPGSIQVARAMRPIRVGVRRLLGLRSNPRVGFLPEVYPTGSA